jgi:hypothetical protein
MKESLGHFLACHSLNFYGGGTPQPAGLPVKLYPRARILGVNMPTYQIRMAQEGLKGQVRMTTKLRMASRNVKRLAERLGRFRIETDTMKRLGWLRISSRKQ